MEDHDTRADRLGSLCAEVVPSDYDRMAFLKSMIEGFEDPTTANANPSNPFAASLGPPLALLVLLLLSLGSELFSGRVIGSTHLDNDLGYFLALRNFAFYGQSNFPLWNPYLMCGVPLIAEIQSGLFYPPNIVFRILPLATAVNVSLFIHLYLLALGTYCFGRQLRISPLGAMIAASVFCFSGPVIIRLFAGHHTDLYTIAWIPAVFFCVDRIGQYPARRNFIYLALIFCLQFLAGHPQYLYYTIFFSWFYLLWATRGLLNRKSYRSWVFRNLGFVFSLGLAGLIALPQILPVIEMLSLSPRQSLAFSDIARFSFPPQNLLTFFMPLVYGDGVRIPYWGLYNLWEMCAYCGTISLLLSIVALKDLKNSTHVVFFLFLAVFALIMALGQLTPLFRLFYHILPGFSMFRGHSKIHLFCCFAVALLAGTGFDALTHSANRKDRRPVWPVLGGLTVLFLVLLMIPYSRLLDDPVQYMLAHFQNDPRSYLPTPGAENTRFVAAVIKQMVMSVRYFLVSLFLGILLVILMRRFGSRRLLHAAIILFILTDLLIFGKTFVSSVDVHHWDLKAEVKELLSQDPQPSRSAVITSLGPRYGITSLLYQLGGDYPYVLSRYSRMYNLANQGTPNTSMKIGNIRRVSPVFNLFNLKYLVVNSERLPEIPGYYEVYNDGALAVLKNEYAKARVYLPQNIKIVDDEDEALQAVFELPTIRGEQIVIERDSVADLSYEYESLLHGADPDETLEIVNYSTDTINLRTRLNADAWVILTDTFYPGWKATIDGQFETTPVPANYLFRAIYVPQGTHEIVFQYRPKYFFVCMMISLTVLLGACAAAVLRKPLLLDFFSGRASPPGHDGTK